MFLVALEPYLFNLIGQASSLSGDIATIAYAIDIGTIYAILASFNNILTSEGRDIVLPDLVRKYRVIRNLQLGVAAIFWVSILPQFYTVTLSVGGFPTPIRYLIWVTTLFFSRGTWFLRRLGRL